MPHDYNTRTKNQEDKNNTLVAIANLVSSFTDETTNLKDVIIKNLQKDNANLN